MHDNTTTARKQVATARVRLVLDVTYIQNGEDVQDLVNRLRRQCQSYIGAGMLTGETSAEVDEHSLTVCVREEEISEEELSAFISRRIENGDLDLEDLANRCARYGVMEPDGFLAEMRERMDSMEQEALEDSLQCKVIVKGSPSDDEDANIPGEYDFSVEMARQVNKSELSDADKSAIAKAVLDEFHQSFGIAYLDDFTITVTMDDGQVIEEGETSTLDLVEQASFLG